MVLIATNWGEMRQEKGPERGPKLLIFLLKTLELLEPSGHSSKPAFPVKSKERLEATPKTFDSKIRLNCLFS